MDTITITTEPSRFPKQQKPKRTMAIETAKDEVEDDLPRPDDVSPAMSEAQKKALARPLSTAPR